MIYTHILRNMRTPPNIPLEPVFDSRSDGSTLTLLNTTCASKPIDPILGVLLHPWFQSSFMQVEVIHSTNSKDTLPWISGTNTIHESSTSLAEIVGHAVPRGDGFGLRKYSQVVSAANVGDISVVDDEVGGEHGGSDFPAVETVAEEGVNETGFSGGEVEAHTAAIAGCCRMAVLRVPIRGATRHRNEGG
jgi:hypothetical protein